MLSKNGTTHEVVSAILTEDIVRGDLSNGSKYVVNVPEKDEDMIKLLRETVKDFDIKPRERF